MKEALEKTKIRFSINPAVGFIVLTMLYFTSKYNYLLFHSLAEIFSIVIACMIFVIGWHSRYYMKNNYLLYISISYLFIGFLDLMHTLSYPGMSIFKDYDYYANQLWIAARYMESIVLLSGFLFLSDREKINHKLILLFMSIITAAIIISIFVWKSFPICFVGGEGLTPFKKNSEYIICVILFASGALLYKNREKFSSRVFRYMLYSIAYTIVAELAFTFYISNYGISNLIGHYFKLFSFYCIYRSMVVTGLEYPQETIFKELVDKEKELRTVNRTKDQLYSILMHDLRGPINTLHDFLHDAKDSFDSYSREEIQAFVEAGHKSISGMNSLVNNLYTWVSSQTGHLKPQPVTADINKLALEAVEPLIRSAESKNIRVVFLSEEDVRISTDKEILKTVVRNLVGNAIKFTDNFGKITINTHKNGENVIITVQDNGQGMSRDVLENLFAVNKQYTSKGTQGEQGSGLGLKVCKDLLDIIKGSININSELSSGTTVTVSIHSI